MDYGVNAARYKLRLLLEELGLMNRQLSQIEDEMLNTWQATGISEYLLRIKGIGAVSLAVCLGETDDPMRFHDSRQLSRLAGYNLIEDIFRDYVLNKTVPALVLDYVPQQQFAAIIRVMRCLLDQNSLPVEGLAKKVGMRPTTIDNVMIDAVMVGIAQEKDGKNYPVTSK